MKNIRRGKSGMKNLQTLTAPKNFCIALATEIPEAGKLFSCNFFVAGSNSNAMIYTRDKDLAYECKQLGWELYKVNGGDAYYFTLMEGNKDPTYLAIAKEMPVAGERYICSRIYVDAGNISTMYWETNIVKYYKVHKTKKATVICEVVTFNRSRYFVLIV